ncbi:MAG: DEAD/DEAH box helicase [Phycisphaerae bacterium]|nr:DEAD/DEAH box helicase [Phycisphaerae bacterium]
MATDAFSLLAPPIQRILWRMRWTALRPIQVDAIHRIIEGQDDIIISARTASGKTEAAFLPILSCISSEPRSSVRAMYIGPLKALINDQFRRLEELCEYAQIPVQRWHGDVSGSQKQSLLGNPSGVLLITPESLESLFVNRSTRLTALFRQLAFVVIDEVHAFVGRERGTHLRSLLRRVESHVNGDYRIVALSATVGDPRITASWLRPERSERVNVITDADEQKEVRYKIYGYRKRRTQTFEEGNQHDSDDILAMANDIYDAHAGTHNLIFANRKADVELFADLLNERCRRDGRPQEFLVHHGSLSKEVREQTEELMRASRPATTLCSATLELGIDIGNVVAVGQIGVPWSVSSLVQRLGRSGRKEGQPSIMRVYVAESEAGPDSDLVDRLYPNLLQAIAMTELMLEKWTEPQTIMDMDLSTFVQQVLSVLAETGGVLAERLFDRLVRLGTFKRIDKPLFVKVLRGIAEHDLIEQMTQGDLILGLGGQRIVSHYDFYSAFATPEEYRVAHEGRPIGTLPALSVPEVNDHIILGGRRWQIVGVDHKRSEITVTPARGRKPPRFLGGGGEIHARVRQKMREVLLGQKKLPYLNEQGCEMLTEARCSASEAALHVAPLLVLSDRSCLWFTWTGTRAQRTLCLMAAAAGVRATDMGIAILFDASASRVIHTYHTYLGAMPDALTLAARIPSKHVRKYDQYLSDELLNESLAECALDLPAAESVIRDAGEPYLLGYTGESPAY